MQGAEERARLCLPGECAVLRPPLTASAASSGSSSGNRSSRDSSGRDTSSKHRGTNSSGLSWRFHPGVNSKRGRCASPGENAVRKPKREQGCASPGECAVLRLPLMATGPQAVAAAAVTAAAATAAEAAADTEAQTAQTADPSLALAIIGDSTFGVNFKGGQCAYPGENAVRAEESPRGVCSLVPASHGNSAASSGSSRSRGTRCCPASVRPRWNLPRAER